MLTRLQLGICVVSMLLSSALTWHVQAWRFERQMAVTHAVHLQQGLDQATALNQQLLNERARRAALEQQLQSSESSHFKELADAQRIQTRLRDRLATADLRLSVLVEPETTRAPATMFATAGAGRVDHGTLRARLDPSHARRIIAITDDGDRGLIALRACQSYVRALLP